MQFADPKNIHNQPLKDAYETAATYNWTAEELDIYDKIGLARGLLKMPKPI